MSEVRQGVCSDYAAAAGVPLYQRTEEIVEFLCLFGGLNSGDFQERQNSL
jgi:hypothetical protein